MENCCSKGCSKVYSKGQTHLLLQDKLEPAVASDLADELDLELLVQDHEALGLLRVGEGLTQAGRGEKWRALVDSVDIIRISREGVRKLSRKSLTSYPNLLNWPVM